MLLLWGSKNDKPLCCFCGDILFLLGCKARYIASDIASSASSLEIDLSIPEERDEEIYDMVCQMSGADSPGFELTNSEYFDYCLTILQKQKEIEPPRPLPELGQYDERKCPYYRLCGDVLLLLAMDANPEDIASWAEHQLSSEPDKKTDRYADKDEIMKEVLEKLSLVIYPGFELTDGEIFLLAMGLLAKSPGREGEK